MGSKKRLKNIEPNIKIADEGLDDSSKIDYPVICLRHLTTNSDHNFDYFKKDKNKKLEAYENFLQKVEEIQKSTWKELMLADKFKGFETLENSQIKFKGKEVRHLVSADTKIYILRFGKDYRLLGFKTSRCSNSFHVIGFDFNYTAYNHGS